MSDAPPRQLGPREARIKELWDQVWFEHSQGGVFEPYIAVAEGELVFFAANLPQNDFVAAADLECARNLHLFQSRYFSVHVSKLEGVRSQLDESVGWIYEQLTAFNQHSVRSLTTANGGVVLATLAYIQAQQSVPSGFFWVILLGAVGYILTLLGSHAVVIFSSKPLRMLFELRQPRLPEKVRQAKFLELTKSGKWLNWVSRPLFYFSGVCLIAALWIGVATLVASKPQMHGAQVEATELHHPSAKKDIAKLH